MRTAPLALLAAAALMVATAAGVAEAQTKPAAAPAKPAAKASPASPLLLQESKDWKAVTAAGPKGKMCFALSKPQKMTPPTLNHGDVVFFMTSRPAENVRNEPSLQVGYPLKESSKVVIDVDGKKFNFFARGDSAWLENGSEYAGFLDALKKGRQMTAAATSGRGNPTGYTFSLSGVSAALDAAAKECK